MSSSTPLIGDAGKKQRIPGGIQELLTPNPYFGKSEPSSAEQKAP